MDIIFINKTAGFNHVYYLRSFDFYSSKFSIQNQDRNKPVVYPGTGQSPVLKIAISPISYPCEGSESWQGMKLHD